MMNYKKAKQMSIPSQNVSMIQEVRLTLKEQETLFLQETKKRLEVRKEC